MKTRTLVIGDIHGGLRGLQQVLERAGLQPTDRLIFLGDYVDGWSESAGVIAFLIGLQETNTCIFIRGNHDTWCETWLERNYADPTWLFHGGKPTVASYGEYEEQKWKRHLNFFESMRDYYTDDMNRLFIHAGFSSMHGPGKEIYASNYSWDRTLWEAAVAMDKTLAKGSPLYPKRLKLFDEIYIGHTPTTDLGCGTPMNCANVWNVDTGAAFKGKLTVLDIDTKEYWQSDPLKDLYPDEKGRNND
ncbi:MAG: pphA2 [Bacteroidetes bacterium]|jgi:serine/threonine protein phosphatase 1|nr:pphA2 [Bacteroidota bacterium]